MPFLLRLQSHAESAFVEFIGEGYIGGVFEVLVDEIALFVAALEHHELVLQFVASHTTC